MAEEIIDLSYDLNTGTPPFPGDPPIATPLKISGRDGSPVRALAIVER